MKTLTIIICTHNRSSMLEDCLASLTRQTASADQFDVLVVDNASVDETVTVTRNYMDRYPHISLCNEPEPGLSRARNTGFRKAITPWIAYLDDDARASENFAERIL